MVNYPERPGQGNAQLHLKPRLALLTFACSRRPSCRANLASGCPIGFGRGTGNSAAAIGAFPIVPVAIAGNGRKGACRAR
jgi:hypothetical protein